MHHILYYIPRFIFIGEFRVIHRIHVMPHIYLMYMLIIIVLRLPPPKFETDLTFKKYYFHIFSIIFKLFFRTLKTTITNIHILICSTYCCVMSDIIPSAMATEEQVKKAKEEQEAVSLKNWDTLGVKRKFVSFVRLAENCWNGDDSWELDANGLYCSKIESGMESVRALKPFSIKLAEPLAEPLQRQLYYFEVTVKELGSNSSMHIGMSKRGFPISSDKFVGSNSGTFSIDNNGYQRLEGAVLDNYNLYSKNHTFTKNDVIGCGLLLLAKGNARIFFTKNGQLHRDSITVDQMKFGDVLYPTVCANSVSDAVEANFGETLEAKQKFLFDLTGISVIDG